MASEVNQSEQAKALAVAPTKSPGGIRLLALLLVLASLLSYLNSLTAPFIFDDESWITGYRRIANWPEDLKNLSVADRPMMHLSVAVNYALGQLDVRGYHVFNLAVHILAGLLLFGIVHQTIRLCNRQSGRGLPAASLGFAVALLWIVHPLQTESVTYVIQRCESMMGMFFLLCLYCVIRGSQAERGWLWYVAGVVACLLGLGCKEVMVTAPPVVLLYDRVFLSHSWRDLWHRRGWVHALLFGSALGLFGFMLPIVLGGTAGVGGFGYQEVSPLAYLRSQPGVILHYLQLVFWPRPLCLDYLWPPAMSPAQIYPPAAAIVALLLASLVAFRYRPWLGFLGVSFFLVLAPTSSIMPIADLAFEHRMYLPLAAVLVLVVLGVYEVTRRGLKDARARQLARFGALTFAASVLVALTCERNADYCDPVRIWTKVLDVSPQNWRAHNALAEAYGSRGDRSLERHHYDQAVAAKPDHARLHFSMAACLYRAGDLAGAALHYRRAVELKPDYVEALFRCGTLAGREQKWDEAEQYYRRALQVKPEHVDAQRNLAVLLRRTGRTGEAVSAYRRLLELRPQMAGVRMQLAKILATAEDDTVRDGAQAVQLAEEARRVLGEGDYRVFDALAAAYAATGRYEEACVAAARSLELAKLQGAADVLLDLKSRLESYQARKAAQGSFGSGPSALGQPTGKES